MDVQLVQQLLSVQTLIATLENMSERLDSEFTPSEKQLIEEFKTQYYGARAMMLRQMGVQGQIPQEEQEQVVVSPQKEEIKLPIEKKAASQKPAQKQGLQQGKKQQEEYPE